MLAHHLILSASNIVLLLILGSTFRFSVQAQYHAKNCFSNGVYVLYYIVDLCDIL